MDAFYLFVVYPDRTLLQEYISQNPPPDFHVYMVSVIENRIAYEYPLLNARHQYHIADFFQNVVAPETVWIYRLDPSLNRECGNRCFSFSLFHASLSEKVIRSF